MKAKNVLWPPETESEELWWQREHTRRESDAPPHAHGHDAMVDHVQVRDVVPLLPQDEEHGVRELDELGYVVPVGGGGHL